MTDSIVQCAVISRDPVFTSQASRLGSDPQRGVNIAVQITTPLTDLGKPLLDELRRSEVQVIFLDLGDDPVLGLRFARFLSDDNPTRTFILTGPTVAPELLLEAMRVGATEYLPQPVDEIDLAAALSRAVRRVSGSQSQQQSRAQGQVYALMSAKGGTGVTTTATNLAVHVRRLTGKKTLLMDLDLEFGGGALLLGLRPRYSFVDVVHNLHRLDQNLLTSFIEQHESGLEVLASPSQPNLEEKVGVEDTRTALQYLRRQYDYIVIDLPRVISPISQAAIERADRVLLLATPDLPTLRNTKKLLPLMRGALGDRSSHVEIVLNRHGETDLISSTDVRDALGEDVFWTLSSDEETVGLSTNSGRPVVLQARSKYGRDLMALGEAITGVHTNGKSKGLGGFMTRLLGRTKPQKQAEENGRG
jgi:pilus assembly protein CpaE